MKKTYDVSIQGSMGFYQFAALTDRGARWVRKNVDVTIGDQHGFYVDDTGRSEDICEGMLRSRLKVLMGGREAYISKGTILLRAAG